MAELKLSTEISKRLSELEEVYRNVEKTTDLINKAKVQYVKRQIKARNRKQATEQGDDYWADVKEYQQREDINTEYGWGTITAEERDRLMEKWDAYQIAKQQGDQYKDAVTDMMEWAASQISQKYADKTNEYLALRKRIADERRRYRWEHRED